MYSIIISMFSTFALICYGSLVGMDIYNKRKLQRESTTYLRWHHLSVIGATILLSIFAALPFNNLGWGQSGIILLLYGVCITGISLWDLRSIKLRPLDPARLQKADSALKRRVTAAACASCIFGTFAISIGALWTIEIITHTFLDRALIGGLMGTLLFLSIVVVAYLHNMWHKQALDLAYAQLQSMPADYASEIEKEYKYFSEQEKQKKKLLIWQAKNFLIGLWPPIILIAVCIWTVQWHWTAAIFIGCWALLGVLAISQSFERITPALATLPNVTEHKGLILVLAYTQNEIFDGVCACSMAIIMLFMVTIPRPFSLITLGISIASLIIIVIGIAVLKYRHRKGDTRKVISPIKQQQAQKAMNNERLSISAIILPIRRATMLIFILSNLIQSFFDPSDQPLIFIYWLLLVGLLGLVVWLCYLHQLSNKLRSVSRQIS